MPHNRFDLGLADCADSIGAFAGEPRGWLRGLASHLSDRVPHGLDGFGEFLWIALSADVHEVHLRLVKEKVVVQGRHF